MKLPLAYAIGSSTLSFFLPAAVMVILYTKLYLYARKHVRSIKTQLQQATSFLIMQLASEKIREVGTQASPARMKRFSLTKNLEFFFVENNRS